MMGARQLRVPARAVLDLDARGVVPRRERERPAVARGPGIGRIDAVVPGGRVRIGRLLERTQRLGAARVGEARGLHGTGEARAAHVRGDAGDELVVASAELSGMRELQAAAE